MTRFMMRTTTTTTRIQRRIQQGHNMMMMNISRRLLSSSKYSFSFSSSLSLSSQILLQQQLLFAKHHQRVVRTHYTYSGPGSYHHHDHDDDDDNDHDIEYAQNRWGLRNFNQRGFTVGIGGPVGSGKTALVLELCRRLEGTNINKYMTIPNSTSHDHHHHDHHHNSEKEHHDHKHDFTQHEQQQHHKQEEEEEEKTKQQQPQKQEQHPFSKSKSRKSSSLLELGVVTNDIFTVEDAEFLVRNNALPRNKIRPVETGGCPHTAIREDISGNISALEELTQQHHYYYYSNNNNNRSKDNNHHHRDDDQQESNNTNNMYLLLLCESGGDNLAANFSSELADMTIYVIDVSGGDKIPRKGGPGITQSDLLVINKIDLATAVGANLDIMEQDANTMRTSTRSKKAKTTTKKKKKDNDDDVVIGPTIFASIKHGDGVNDIVDFILSKYKKAMRLMIK